MVIDSSRRGVRVVVYAVAKGVAGWSSTVQE